MPPVARVGDITTHGGTIIGPGAATVFVGGMPVAVAGDLHVCALPPTGHQPTVSPLVMGSTTVFAGGLPVVRAGDMTLCGATPAIGAPTVIVGG